MNTNTLNTIKGYRIRDYHTNTIIKEYREENTTKAHRKAMMKADKLDLIFGAVRYGIEPIY